MYALVTDQVPEVMKNRSSRQVMPFYFGKKIKIYQEFGKNKEMPSETCLKPNYSRHIQKQKLRFWVLLVSRKKYFFHTKNHVSFGFTEKVLFS